MLIVDCIADNDGLLRPCRRSSGQQSLCCLVPVPQSGSSRELLTSQPGLCLHGNQLGAWRLDYWRDLESHAGMEEPESRIGFCSYVCLEIWSNEWSN